MSFDMFVDCVDVEARVNRYLVRNEEKKKKKVFWTQWTARTEVIPPQGLRNETRESDWRATRTMRTGTVAGGAERRRNETQPRQQPRPILDCE